MALGIARRQHRYVITPGCQKIYLVQVRFDMDERQRALCAQLVRVNSDQAADWLMTKYPIESADWGEALLLIPHRTWKRSDQKRLAKYYFRKLPFSGPRGYESFAAIMSIKLLIGCVAEAIPAEASKVELLLYYLIPILNKLAKNDSSRQLVREFVAGL
ncbi:MULTISPECIES: hypothetical protein [unclassified Pseudomonas]|uniref:hypothetical protein n=1 Tax=unclassified Pseudomonas TaxID=196821 RepID=UPI001D1444F0|nr:MULTISPECIES: hypothetical protein [unclassified Pseudomonas]